MQYKKYPIRSRIKQFKRSFKVLVLALTRSTDRGWSGLSSVLGYCYGWNVFRSFFIKLLVLRRSKLFRLILDQLDCCGWP